MPRPIHLRVAIEPDGSWRISVGDGETRPVEGLIARAEVEALLAATAARLSARPRVMVPGEDGLRARAEAEVGQLLLGALPKDGPGGGPFGKLRALMGVAAGEGRPALIVVDAADATARALPWELLAGDDGLPIEVAQAGVVARLSPGLRVAGGAGRAGPLRLLIWNPTPEDPTCAQLRAQLDRLALELDLALVELDGAAPERLPEALDEARPEVLHIICHGRRGFDEVGLRLGAVGSSAEATAARLGPLLARVDMVMMAVCAGADATERELDSLAARLVACGARSCVAPLRRAGAEALEHAVAGLYTRLVARGTPAQAVGDARRVLRAWGHPHPISRWSNLCWLIPDLATAAAGPLLLAGWQPAGWPRPGADAAALLLAARERSSAQGDGFVGIEHLISALPGVAGGGMLSAWLRRASAGRMASFDAALSQLTPQDADRLGQLSPRLRGWGERLKAGFDLEALFLMLSDEPDLARALLGDLPMPLGGDDPFATIDTPPRPGGGPAGALRVLGGPEDGRTFSPQPGERLGRHADAGGPEHGLYQTTRLTDRKLSRNHLLWLGDGWIELHRPATLTRDGVEHGLPVGRVEIAIGDLLVLTPATRLVGIG